MSEQNTIKFHIDNPADHPCKGCDAATTDEERFWCDAAGLALKRVDWANCPNKPIPGEGGRSCV